MAKVTNLNSNIVTIAIILFIYGFKPRQATSTVNPLNTKLILAPTKYCSAREREREGLTPEIVLISKVPSLN